MIRLRQLTQRDTGKSWSTSTDGAVVTVRTGDAGKTTIKSFDNPGAALDWVEKQEWARLKKGQLLAMPDAAPGQPRMHRYRGRGYTGALAIADLDGQMLCNQFDDARGGDLLFLLDADGEPSPLPDLPPQRLAWEAFYLPGLHRLLVRADHQIMSWLAGEAGFTELSAANRQPVSCLAVSGSGWLAVWYAQPDLIVAELDSGNILLRLPLDAELYGNHTSQMAAALSPDGKTLAYCHRAGQIVLRDIASGATLATVSEAFQMVDELRFSLDGRFLIVSEQYGLWQHLRFELAAPHWRSEAIADNIGAGSLALSPDGTRIAVARRGHIDVLDAVTLAVQLRFRVEHMVKRCAIGWVGPYLGVQTDYGCASLYAV